MFLKKNKQNSNNNNQKPTKIIVPENLLAAEAYDLAKKFLDFSWKFVVMFILFLT